MDITVIAIYAGVGFVAGVMAGLFGIGGGVILVPTLYYTFLFLGYQPELVMTIAVATSLAIIIVNGFSATVTHLRCGHMNLREVAPMAIGGMIGAVLVTVLVLKISGDTVRRAFGIFEILLAIQFLTSRPKSKSADKPDENTPTDHQTPVPQPVSVSKFLIIGLLSGLVAGTFGVGGGVIAVPALVLMLGFEYTRGVGISSGMVAACALAGAVSYAFMGYGLPGLPATALGYVDLLAAAIVAPLGIVGANIGAKLTVRLDETLMKRLFAVALLLIGLRMVF
jgi:uncharacterized protein